MSRPAKIAIVGCGALGSYYGAHLARTNPEVWFLLRSDYDAVAQRGVRIETASGPFVVRPRIARRPEDIGPCDWVVIGLKSTANDQFIRLLPPLVGDTTAVITLQNGLGNEEALAEVVGASRVLGGLCFVCLNRLEPGVIHHLAHGRIVMGEFQRPASDRARAFASWIRAAGIPCDLSDDLERVHWEKLVWNIPFNGLGVASAAGFESVLAGKVLNPSRLGPCLPTDLLLADPGWLGLVRELMQETIAAARAQGMSIPDTVAEHQIERTLQMGAYRASTLIDYERGLPLELESMFAEPLLRARRAGRESPRLQALVRVLAELDGLRLRP